MGVGLPLGDLERRGEEEEDTEWELDTEEVPQKVALGDFEA